MPDASAGSLRKCQPCWKMHPTDHIIFVHLPLTITKKGNEHWNNNYTKYVISINWKNC